MSADPQNSGNGFYEISERGVFTNYFNSSCVLQFSQYVYRRRIYYVIRLPTILLTLHFDELFWLGLPFEFLKHERTVMNFNQKVAVVRISLVALACDTNMAGISPFICPDTKVTDGSPLVPS